MKWLQFTLYDYDVDPFSANYNIWAWIWYGHNGISWWYTIRTATTFCHP
jgi:hypothetical protein